MYGMQLLNGVLKSKELFEILRRLDSYADIILCDGHEMKIHSPGNAFFLVQHNQQLDFVVLKIQCAEDAWTERFTLRDGVLGSVQYRLEPENLSRWQEWLPTNRHHLLQCDSLLKQPWPELGLIRVHTGMYGNLLHSSYRSYRMWKYQFNYCASLLRVPYPALVALTMNNYRKHMLIWIHTAKQCGFRWTAPSILMKGKQWIGFQSNHRGQIIIDLGKPLSRWISRGQHQCLACPIEQLNAAIDVNELRQAMLDIKE